MKITSITLLACCLFPFTFQAQDLGAKWIIPPILEGIDGLEISPRGDDSRFVVERKGKKGLYDKSGKVILPVECSSIVLDDNGCITFYRDGKLQLLNAKGEQIGLSYDKFILRLNTIIVYKNKLCGVINQQGEELIPVEYERYVPKSDHLVFIKGTEERSYQPPPVKTLPNVERANELTARSPIVGYSFTGQHNQRGLINAKGLTVVPPLYAIGTFHASGYITAQLDKNWGVLDLKHQVLHPFTLNEVGAWTKSGLLPVRQDKQWAVLRFPKGEVVIPFGVYDKITVISPDKELFQVKNATGVGIIDAKGKVLLPLEYEYTDATYPETIILQQNRLLGTWHPASGYLVEPKYRRIDNRKDSLCIVQTDSTSALIDVKTGKEIIPFSPFNLKKAGPYFISEKAYEHPSSSFRMHGLYNRKGQLLIAPDSINIEVYDDGSYFIYPHFKKSTQFSEHRTADGKLLRSTDKMVMAVHDHDWFHVVQTPEGKHTSKHFSHLDPPGKEQYYDKLGKAEENLRLVKQGDKWGFTDKEGRIVLPLVFEAAHPSLDGYIRVKYEGKWGVLQNPKYDYFEELTKSKK